MAVFVSDVQLYSVLRGVFERVVEHPDHIEAFTSSNLVIRMQFSEPTAEVLMDGRQPPLEVFYGPTPGKANLEFSMPADLLHRIWLGEVSTTQAFFTGKIRSKGNVMKAISLADLFRECERVYPEVAANHNLL